MTTLFPSSLDNFTNPHGSLSGGSDKLSTPGVIHGVQHQNINDAMAAVEAKLGIDSSATITSIDYLLKNILSVDPGHKHTAASITGVGTVTSISVASANGFAGSVANPTTTPAITLSTTITGLLKGNGTAISAASSGTDYEVPLTFSTGLTRTTNTVTVNTTQNIAKLSNLTSNGFVKTGSSDGTLSIDTSTYLTASGAVTSIAGTANQITASASTGAVTLSLPSAITTPGSLTVTTDFVVNGNTTIGDASTDTLMHNAAVITIPTALVYTKTAQAGVAETLFSWKVSDSATVLSIANSTSNDGEFAPNITSAIEVGKTTSAVVFSGTLGSITTTNPSYVFLGRANGGAGNVDLAATQIIATFRNRATDAFQFTGGYNLLYLGGGTSPTLNAFASDTVATAGVDRVNTRHTAAGNRLWAMQSEKGAVIYVGDDALDFAATTAYISVNGTDTVTLIAGQMGLGVTPGAVIDLLGSTTSAASLRIRSGTAPTSPNNGDVWNDATQNMIAFYNGNTLYQSGNLYTATSGVTINTTTPTTSFSSTKIGTTTIKANTLKIGQKFIIWGSGYYSTPLANTATVTITVKIGSVTVSTVTTAAFPASATNLPFDFLLQFTVQAIGSGTSAKIVCDGSFNYATALSAVAKTSNSLSSIGQIGFDSTADQAMDVLASWSAVTTQTAIIQQSKIDFL